MMGANRPTADPRTHYKLATQRPLLRGGVDSDTLTIAKILQKIEPKLE